MSKRNRVLYTAFIFLVLGLVIFIGARNGDFPASLRAMLAIPRRYTLLSVLCVFCGILMQAFSASSALRVMGQPVSLYRMYGISLLGEFYSFITPGASGGQPMQVYQMRKQGIPVGDATSALVIHYACYHAALLLTDVVLGIRHRAFVCAQIGGNLAFLVIGFAFNLMLVVGALMLSFYQRPIRWLLDKVISIMRRLKIGNPDQLRDRFSATADSFYTGMRFMMAHRLELARQLAFAIGRVACMTSVFYFLCRGLGQTEAGYGSLAALGAMQYTSAGYTPLPGASGAQEVIFSLYFDNLLPGDLMLSGLLAWRFITYYLILIVGGLYALRPRRDS